jgi:hypothetical protein
MEVHVLATIEGEPAVPLTQKINRRIIIRSALPPAAGVALSLDAAERAHVVRTCRDIGFLGLAAILGGAIFFVPRDQIVTCIFIVLATLGALLLVAVRLSARWREEARMFSADMPAPGTPVSIDDTGLTLAGVNLRKVRSVNGQMFHRYYVDRLLLDTDGGRIALDGAAITQGQQIVDATFNRLYPET